MDTNGESVPRPAWIAVPAAEGQRQKFVTVANEMIVPLFAACLEEIGKRNALTEHIEKIFMLTKYLNTALLDELAERVSGHQMIVDE